ncbi:MAG TPA: hypothetical protein PLS66_09015 [Tepiditoga sp.]|nr:hypothetical protein [Tepiditoga sp.]
MGFFSYQLLIFFTVFIPALIGMKIFFNIITVFWIFWSIFRVFTPALLVIQLIVIAVTYLLSIKIYENFGKKNRMR